MAEVNETRRFWILVGGLVLGGLLLAFAAGFIKFPPLANLTESLGDGFVVAGILAACVERSSRVEAMKGITKELAIRFFAPYAPPELVRELHHIQTCTLVRVNCKWEVQLSWHDDAHTQLFSYSRLEYQIRNLVPEEARYKHKHFIEKSSLGPSEIIEVGRTTPSGAPVYRWKPGDKPPLAAHGTADIPHVTETAQEIKWVMEVPVAHGCEDLFFGRTNKVVRAEDTEILHFPYPTLRFAISVSHPDDLECLSSLAYIKDRKPTVETTRRGERRVTWTENDAFLTDQCVWIEWKRSANVAADSLAAAGE